MDVGVTNIVRIVSITRTGQLNVYDPASSEPDFPNDHELAHVYLSHPWLVREAKMVPARPRTRCLLTPCTLHSVHRSSHAAPHVWHRRRLILTRSP